MAQGVKVYPPTRVVVGPPDTLISRTIVGASLVNIRPDPPSPIDIAVAAKDKLLSSIVHIKRD